MLISAVVDPNIFKEKRLSASEDKTEAEFLLINFLINGIIIFDNNDKIKSLLVKNVASLPSSCKRIENLVVELLKDNKRTINCRQDALGLAPSASIQELVCRLYKCCKVDAAIVHGIYQKPYSQENAINFILLSEYSNSDLEKKRKKMDQGLGPIDEIPMDKFQDIFIRIVRFAKWLRFYDSYLGKTDRPEKWFAGLKFILELWQTEGHFSKQNEGFVEVYTCEKHRITDHQTKGERQYKADENKKAIKTIQNKLVKPLKKIFPWPINVHLKKDEDHIFHARFLQTQSTVIKIDRGFDLFNSNKTVKRNFLELTNGCMGHLRECRELPETSI